MNLRPTKILIIDDELPIREVLSASLKDEGFDVITAADGAQGLSMIDQHQPAVVFLDIWMPGSLDGLEVLQKAKAQFPQVDFIMISGHGTIETAVKSTKLGAWDFIEKPLSMDKISIAIGNILQLQEERREKESLLNRFRQSLAILGESQGVILQKQFVSRAAQSDLPLVLWGEQGSGKALAAKNIHYLSSRAGKTFVEMSARTIPAELFELELKGCATDYLPSKKNQRGKIEIASSGTIYLDDVTDLSSENQKVLLGLLSQKEFSKLGSSETRAMDVRWIFSSTKNIELEVKEGRFREDLFYKMSSQVFRIPSLREKKEDLPILVEHFMSLAAREDGGEAKSFNQKSYELLSEHTWPGNIRELKNFIERVYILTPTDEVNLPDLKFAGLSVNSSAIEFDGLKTFREARAVFEKEFLVQKLDENDGNISRTAEAIGLERSYLHRKIKAYGIEVQKGAEDSL